MSCTAGYITGLALGLPTGIVAGVLILFGLFCAWVVVRLLR